MHHAGEEITARIVHRAAKQAGIPPEGSDLISTDARLLGKRLLDEAWEDVPDAKGMSKSKPVEFTRIMIQSQLDLLRLYLPKMDAVSAERAVRTIVELEGKLQ